jgi:hypothetical protein
MPDMKQVTRFLLSDETEFETWLKAPVDEALSSRVATIPSACRSSRGGKEKRNLIGGLVGKDGSPE